MFSKVGPPVVVGGVGGSGTRLIAEMLIKLNYHIGDNLNVSKDNLDLDLLPEIRQKMLRTGQKNYANIDNFVLNRLSDFRRCMYLGLEENHKSRLGWKIPAIFYILEFLDDIFPKYRYIHVIRHGLDMAYSKNQNQVINWGFFFEIDIENSLLPVASLKYWAKANQYAISQADRLLGERFYLLNYDQMCASPKTEVRQLTAFLNVPKSDSCKLIDLVKRPASSGRHKLNDLSVFDDADLKQLKHLGFSYED